MLAHVCLKSSMKKCTYCKEDKDIYLFGKNKARHDGVQTYCLELNKNRNIF